MRHLCSTEFECSSAKLPELAFNIHVQLALRLVKRCRYFVRFCLIFVFLILFLLIPIPEARVERNDDINPFWIEDKALKKGPVSFLSMSETTFWKELIEKYLAPIDDDKVEKVTFAVTLIFFHLLS